MFEEFKKFAFKGNVLDMAVGIIIGVAFGKIVSSFVASVVMPVVGLLVGALNVTHLKIILKEAQGDIPAVSLDYGVFLQSVIDLLIVAFSVFLMVKAVQSAKREKPAPTPTPEPSDDVKLLSEIRDLLKK